MLSLETSTSRPTRVTALPDSPYQMNPPGAACNIKAATLLRTVAGAHGIPTSPAKGSCDRVALGRLAESDRGS